MSLDSARATLAKAQAALVQVLTGRTRTLNDFDASRLQAATEALLLKRARGVGRAWPVLQRALSGRFLDCFADFAMTTSIPRHGGPLADGRAFVRYLEKKGQLPEKVPLQALAVDLRHTAVQHGLLPRRLPCLRIGWFPQCVGWVLAVRIPWLGEYWWSTGRRTSQVETATY